MPAWCRVVVLGVASLVLLVQPSTAQSERRAVLGTSISVDVKTRTSLDRSDFVGPPLRGTPHLSERIPPISGALARPSAAPERIMPRLDSTSDNVWDPVGLGLLSGAFGLFAGGLIGSSLAETNGCHSPGCALGPFIRGAIVGETAGLSSGVYFGTERRGSYLLTLLGGALGSAVTVGLATASDRPETLLLGPVLQFGITIPIARADR